MEKEYLIRTQLIYFKERESNMCLYRVDLVKKGLSRKVCIGYKIFIRSESGDLNFQFMYIAGRDKVEFDKWLFSEQKRLCSGGMTSGGKYYKSGFHIFKYKADALDLIWDNTEIVTKVKYTGVLAEGVELDSREVVVVKRMYVPRRQRKSEGKKMYKVHV